MSDLDKFKRHHADLKKNHVFIIAVSRVMVMNARDETAGIYQSVLNPLFYLTLTFPYFHVNRTTAGRQAMMQHSSIRIAVRINQFNETTHGEPSSHDSHPSAQGRHSKIPSTAYWLSACWNHYDLYLKVCQCGNKLQQRRLIFLVFFWISGVRKYPTRLWIENFFLNATKYF